jgi:hypothetical protein
VKILGGISRAIARFNRWFATTPGGDNWGAAQTSGGAPALGPLEAAAREQFPPEEFAADEHDEETE